MSALAIRHFLLDKRAGWRSEPMLVDAVELSDGVLRLQPLPGAPQPVTDASGTFGGLADPLGVGVGGDGTIVILDRAGARVLRYDPCSQSFAPLACLSGALALAGARDIEVTYAGDVVIADTGNRRLLVLVGAGLGIRAVIGPLMLEAGAPSPALSNVQVPSSSGCAATAAWPEGVWEPWGVATSRRRIVVTDHANGLVHLFDQCGRWLAATDGSGPQAAALVKPTGVAVDRRGNIFVLQEGSPRVRALDDSGGFVADVESLDERRHDFCPIAVAVAPDGTLCLAGAGGELCLLTGAGPDWTAVGAGAIDAPVRGLAFDHDGDPLLVDGQQCCVVRMRSGAGYPKQGKFLTTGLDSRLSGCRWHRIALTAAIPEGTAVQVDTLTAEAPLSPSELAAVPAERWATGQVVAAVKDGRWDCLVRSDGGRYLWLSLTLQGDGAQTPEVDDVEVWFPRSTSLAHLPRAFATDPAGGDFLERYTAILDRERQTVTDALDRITALFDPMAVPARDDGNPDFLSWLAGWVGMAIDERLPITRRRLLARDAAELYRLRGTPEGVRRFVSLFCGVEVRVLEHYRLRRWAITGRGRLGDTSTLFGPAIVKRLQLGEFSEIDSFQLVDTDDPRRDPFFVYASKFSLFLLCRADQRLLAQAQRVAELAKPAHTQVDIEAIEPRQRVGIQSTIGLDTVVGEIPAPGRAGEAQLGQGLVVGPDARLGGRRLAQVGVRAQVGVNTGLE